MRGAFAARRGAPRLAAAMRGASAHRAVAPRRAARAMSSGAAPITDDDLEVTSTKVLHRDPAAPLPVATPSGAFAVVRLGGTQYKVTHDDVIVAEKLDVAVGTTLILDEVLLVGSEAATVVGRPTIPNAKVICQIEEQTQDAKVVVFKKRRRQNSRRRNGHRRDVTLLRVTEIDAGEGSDVVATGLEAMDAQDLLKQHS